MLLRLQIVTRKKLSGNGVTSTVPVQFLSWLLPTLSARGQNLAGSFSTVNFAIKSWNKSHSRQAGFCFKLSRGLVQSNINVWSQLLDFLLFKFYRKIWWCCFQSSSSTRYTLSQYLSWIHHGEFPSKNLVLLEFLKD